MICNICIIYYIHNIYVYKIYIYTTVYKLYKYLLYYSQLTTMNPAKTDCTVKKLNSGHYG